MINQMGAACHANSRQFAHAKEGQKSIASRPNGPSHCSIRYPGNNTHPGQAPHLMPHWSLPGSKARSS